MQEEPHLPFLERAGLALLIVGGLDIAVMIFCIWRGITYSSSFNVFAVIAGIFLFRGSLRAASVIQWFAVFIIAAMGAMLLMFPLTQPLDLTLTQLRLERNELLKSMAFTAFVVALLVWIIKQLSAPEVLSARSAAGGKTRSLKVPASIGVGLAIAMSLIAPLLLGGNSGSKAQSLAQEQVGPGYSFHTTALRVAKSTQGTLYDGSVVAWNAREIRYLSVNWRE